MHTKENKNNLIWAFFGTSDFSVIVLDELKKQGYLPALIITTEDKPKGRKLFIAPPEVKVWAESNHIDYIQPVTLNDQEVVKKIKSQNATLFVVASYGKLLPKNILEIPPRGTLNVHPSLLPKLRGASPIQSAILSESETGVTIIKLDSEMDHGPNVATKNIISWQNNINALPYENDLAITLACEGGQLLALVLDDWVSGKLHATEQDHSKATYTKKIQKSDGLIDLSGNAEINLRKIRAYVSWPGAYFFENDKRIIVQKAHIEESKLILDRITPEGKKEMSYKDFLKGLQN